MSPKHTKTGDGENADDARNKGFGGRGHTVEHKPGFDSGGPKRKPETGGDHAFRRSDQKDVPQGSLADRISKSKKGA